MQALLSTMGSNSHWLICSWPWLASFQWLICYCACGLCVQPSYAGQQLSTDWFAVAFCWMWLYQPLAALYWLVCYFVLWALLSASLSWSVSCYLSRAQHAQAMSCLTAAGPRLSSNWFAVPGCTSPHLLSTGWFAAVLCGFCFRPPCASQHLSSSQLLLSFMDSAYTNPVLVDILEIAVMLLLLASCTFGWSVLVSNSPFGTVLLRTSSVACVTGVRYLNWS